MTKHTAGPWLVNGKQSIRGSNGEYIAKAHRDNFRGNVPLIVAAPDLLEALKQMRDCFEHSCYDEPSYFKILNASRAIAKAEGLE